MPRFDSPIGGRNIQGGNFKTFEVEDPNQEIPYEDVKQYQQDSHKAKLDKLNHNDRMNPLAKQRIEYLCGISRLNRTVKINEITFILQSLKNKEYRLALKEVAKVAGTIEEPFEMVKQMLCRSIISIDGVSFEDFIGSDDLELKKNFIEELGMAFCNRLYSEYSILNDEINKKFSIDTKEKVEDLVNDLKK